MKTLFQYVWEPVTKKKDLTATIKDASVIFAAFRDHCEILDIAMPRCDNVSFPLCFRDVSSFEDKDFTQESGELYSLRLLIFVWHSGGGSLCRYFFKQRRGIPQLFLLGGNE